jgi:tRNA(Ile2) C34 agmatinyltransferase TiaS
MKFPSFGGKKFKCEACGQTFKKEEELHEHERQVHLQGSK